VTWIFGRQHTPIELPDTPQISRTDANIIHEAGITLADWMAKTDAERADIRWNFKMGATA
jgi:hypothetical protein